MKNNIFGPHLTLDLQGIDYDKLIDYQYHFDFLQSLPKMLKMTPITQPYVFPYEGLVSEDKGITGILIIAESHISIHSFQEKGWSFIDIFSCKPFNVLKCTNYILEYWKPRKYKKHLIKRGVEFLHTDK